MDSLETQQDEMASGKDSARNTITWLLGVSGGIGLLVVFWLVLGNLIKVRRAGQDLALELDLEMDGLHRAQSVVEFVFLFATIVAFFCSILALLRLL